jgi:hypothetical protein
MIDPYLVPQMQQQGFGALNQGIQRLGQIPMQMMTLRQMAEATREKQQQRALREKIKNIYAANTVKKPLAGPPDPTTGQPSRYEQDRRGILMDLQALGPEGLAVAQKQQNLWLQKDAAAQKLSGKGKTQGPAAQILIDPVSGKAYQASRDPKDPTMTELTIKGKEGETPTFMKEGDMFPDPEGNLVYRAPGQTTTTPVVAKGTGERIKDPGVLKGKAETGIKYAQLAQEREKLDMAVEKFEENRAQNLIKHETFKRKSANRIEELEEFASVAKRLADNPALKGITGIGKVGKYLPSSKWADADTDRQLLIAKSAIQSMEKLKAESSNGATGFGSMQANELKIIIDNFATLENTDQSPPKMRETLLGINAKINRWIERQKAFEKKVGYIKGSKYEQSAPAPTMEPTETWSEDKKRRYEEWKAKRGK